MNYITTVLSRVGEPWPREFADILRSFMLPAAGRTNFRRLAGVETAW